MDRLLPAGANVPLATEFLGLTAASLSVVCFIPQAVQIYQGQDTADLSIASFVALFASALLWMAYGVARADWPLMLTNVIQLFTVLYIIHKIMSNAKRRRAGQPPGTAESAEGHEHDTV